MKKTAKSLRLAALLLCAFICVGVFSACTDVAPATVSSGGGTDETVPKSKPVEEGRPSEAAPSQPDEVLTSGYEPEAPPAAYAERVSYFTNLSIGADVHDVFFNNSVFVGNSIMLHFSGYASAKRTTVPGFFGDAYFFAAASFSMYNNKHQKPSSPDCALPSYKGERLNIGEAVEKMEVKTVYLSLMALNDIALYSDGATGVAETYKLTTQLIDELKGKNSDIIIVIISNTYLHSTGNSSAKKLNNGTIGELNGKMLDYCNANAIDFINVATVLNDDGGSLGTEFCNDLGSAAPCHLNTYAYNAWTKILRDYAAQKTAGNYKNPEKM